MKMGVGRLYFFKLQPKSMITFKRWGNAIVSDSPGLERGCDSFHHIITPLCIFLCVFSEFHP